MKKHHLCFLLTLLLALGLTACGGSGGYDRSDDPANAWDVMADEDFSDDVTAWQGDDGSQLLVDISTSSYTYRTWYNRVGTGSLFRDAHGLGLKYCEIGAEYYYYLVREGGGFTVRHIGDGEGRQYGEINGLHCEPAQGETAAYDISLLDGVWQNALGETFAFDTGQMRVIECFTDGTMSSGPLYESTDGRGAVVTGPEMRVCDRPSDPLSLPQRRRQRLCAVFRRQRAPGGGRREHRRVLPQRRHGAVR